MKDVAEKCDVQVRKEPRDLEFAMRRVLFFDTVDFDLYKNAFILRKRVVMTAGFTKAHESTFKFRHPEFRKSQSVDIRRAIGDSEIVKFKEEILLPSDGSNGFRSVYSHNHVHLSPNAEAAHTNFSQLARSFRCSRR